MFVFRNCFIFLFATLILVSVTSCGQKKLPLNDSGKDAEIAQNVVTQETAQDANAPAENAKAAEAEDANVDPKIDTSQTDNDAAHDIAALLEQGRKAEACTRLLKWEGTLSDALQFERNQCEFAQCQPPFTDAVATQIMDRMMALGEKDYLPALSWTMAHDSRGQNSGKAYQRGEKILRANYENDPSPENAFALGDWMQYLPRVPQEANDLIKNAADKGYPPAIAAVGIQLFEDESPENKAKGLEMLHQAVEDKQVSAALALISTFDFEMRETKDESAKKRAIDEILNAAPVALQMPLTCKVLNTINEKSDIDAAQKQKASTLLAQCSK